MRNLLHTKIAFDDWVKENVLNKIATKIVYNGDKQMYLNLEVTDPLDLKNTLRTLHMTYVMRNIINKRCAGIYRKGNIRAHVTNTECGVNGY